MKLGLLLFFCLFGSLLYPHVWHVVGAQYIHVQWINESSQWEWDCAVAVFQNPIDPFYTPSLTTYSSSQISHPIELIVSPLQGFVDVNTVSFDIDVLTLKADFNY